MKMRAMRTEMTRPSRSSTGRYSEPAENAVSIGSGAFIRCCSVLPRPVVSSGGARVGSVRFC